jgi:hypothetical protein
MNLADVRADGDAIHRMGVCARRMRLVTQQLVLGKQPSAKARLLHSLAMKKLTGLVATTMLVSGVWDYWVSGWLRMPKPWNLGQS